MPEYKVRPKKADLAARVKQLEAKLAALRKRKTKAKEVVPEQRSDSTEVTDAMLDAGAEVLYGHPRHFAREWAKLDKFDSCAEQAEEVYRAMVAARDSTEVKGGADAVDGPIGAVLAYDTKGHPRACGQTCGADGSGEFVIIFHGTPEECNDAAYRHIRAMEANGYRFNSVINVMDGDVYSGPSIRHVDASSRAIAAESAAQGNQKGE